MRVVISQSMYFPWVGFLEQIRLADVFVHYDDVQFSKGSFTNRVQIKASTGVTWMSVPLRDLRLGQVIDNVAPAPVREWKNKHLDLLRRSFQGSMFGNDAIALAESVLQFDYENIGALGRASMKALIDYFGVGGSCQFLDARALDIPGRSSQRVLDIVKAVGGTEYITGHGASNYLDHDLFAANGIAVNYMAYEKFAYPQLHGEFTPYVSSLDLVANCGRGGARYICSETISSKDFFQRAETGAPSE